jgi:hypothetical protein
LRCFRSTFITSSPKSCIRLILTRAPDGSGTIGGRQRPEDSGPIVGESSSCSPLRIASSFTCGGTEAIP